MNLDFAFCSSMMFRLQTFAARSSSSGGMEVEDYVLWVFYCENLYRMSHFFVVLLLSGLVTCSKVTESVHIAANVVILSHFMTFSSLMIVKLTLGLIWNVNVC